MNCSRTDFCLFALEFIFHHQYLEKNSTEEVSISVPFSGYNTRLSIILVAIFRSWNVLYLEVSSAGKWAHHQFGHEREKQKEAEKDIWKEVIGMLILWFVEPRQLSHVFMASTDS